MPLRNRVGSIPRYLTGRALAEAAFVCLAYLVLGLASYRLTYAPELNLAGSWLPSGLSLAVLVSRKRERWPLLLLAVFVADALLLGSRGVDPAIVVGWSVADVVEPLVGATLIRRAMPTRGLPLLRAREVYLLGLYGTLAGPMAGTALALVTTLLAGEPPASILSFSLAWWGSAALGTASLAALLLAARPRILRAPPSRLAEAILLGSSLVVLTAQGFMLADVVARFVALGLAAFPVLAWAAIRFGPSGAAWGAAAISLLAVILTARGYGPFAELYTVQEYVRVVLVQALFALATITALLLAAMTAERRRAESLQRMLVDAGTILASISPLQDRVERALRRSVHTLGPTAIFWRSERPFVPEAFAQREGMAPPTGLRLAELAGAGPPEGLEQRCEGASCWLRLPVGTSSFNPAGVLAVEATTARRYFDPSETQAVEALGSRLALECERDRLLGESERLYRDAQEAVRVRDEFLSVASHELKTPLTPLATRLQMLQRRVRAGLPVDEAAIERAQASLGRLAWLINDLLDVTRIQAGTMEMQQRPISLTRIAENAVAATAPRDSGRIRFEAAGEVLVQGDPNRLEQVVSNLVDNALKYSSGEVVVAIRNEGTQAHLTVSDHGIGIPAEQLEQLFERFFRARNASSASYGGLGLGLYIVRDIVERHGGRIWAESAEGRGATFHVSLPVLHAAAFQTEKEARGARQLH